MAWRRSKSARLLEMQERKESGSETWLHEPDSSFKQVSAELLQPFADRQVVHEIGPEAAVSYAEQLLKR